MKLNFKKISAIAASTLLTGMTLGIAAAATYPAPFVNGSGVANVAIVYGTGTGVSATDQVQAGMIQTALAKEVKTGSVTVAGDAYKFEKTSTKFHLGDNITGVISSSLDDDELPKLLAPGVYLDDSNNEIDYTQKITVGDANQLTMFEDNDYAADTPTVGVRIPSGQNVLTYTLTFEDTLLVTDMPTTDLPLMGKKYYVLSNDTTSITLLDSAATATVKAGESVTLDVDGTSYVVTAEIFDTTNSKVKLKVNGETTNLLASTETQKLSDGAYVGVKEVVVQNFAGGTNQVEFSIGSGKLKITPGSDVQINDQAVNGLVGTLTNMSTNTLSSISLAWAADNDLFVAEDSSVTMPGFEAVTLSFGGLNYPAEETISVEKGGTTYGTLKNFPLKDGPADINFLYGDSTSFTGLGKDADNLLKTAKTSGNMTLTYDQDTDDYFVISWSDGSDAESYLARFTNFVLDGSTNKTDLQYYADGAWVTKKSGAKDSDTISLGNAEIKVHNVSRAAKTADVQNNSANTNFNTLYSKEGLTVYLPWENSTFVDHGNNTAFSSAANACSTLTLGVGELYTGILQYNASITSTAFTNTSVCATTFVLKTVEEDKNGNKGSSATPGDTINVTLGWDSSTTAEVEVTGVATSNTDATSTEIGDTDVWRDFTYSALATEILWNKPSSGQKSLKVMYHGDEVAASVYVTEAGATSVSGALGDVLVKDSEVSSVASKNLVIVGGSCINSAAATALGGAYCGEAFTAATGVGAGEFLIKGFDGKFASGKLALVVAGYDADDTVNAATYLTKKAVDTSKEYKGTSATSAELVVA